MSGWYVEWCCLIPSMGVLAGLTVWAFLVVVKAVYAFAINTWER